MYARLRYVDSLSGRCLWCLWYHSWIDVSTLVRMLKACCFVRRLYAFPFSRCSVNAFCIYLTLSMMHGPKFLSAMNMINLRSSVRVCNILCSLCVRFDLGFVLLFFTRLFISS